MKKLFSLFFILFFLSSISVYSQEPPKFVYCEIVGTTKMMSRKITIQIDFGERMKLFADNRLKDESGKAIVFNSMVDALNSMGKQGWEFSQAYAVSNGSYSVYHYLMQKPFDKLDKEAQQEYLSQKE